MIFTIGFTHTGCIYVAFMNEGHVAIICALHFFQSVLLLL